VRLEPEVGSYTRELCEQCCTEYYASSALRVEHQCASTLRIGIRRGVEAFAAEAAFMCAPGLQTKVLQASLDYCERLAFECRNEQPLTLAQEYLGLFARHAHEAARDDRIRQGQTENGIHQIPCELELPSPDGLVARMRIRAGRAGSARLWVGSWWPPVQQWERVDWRRRREASSMSLPEYIARRAVIFGLDAADRLARRHARERQPGVEEVSDE
jgi:hypothetical protein